MATYLAILLFNAYCLSLFFDEQLILYIHPRYVLFTVALNALSAVACTVGFVLAAWRIANGEDASGVRDPWRPSIVVLVAGLVLVAAFALPARTLSSDTADQRSDNFNSSQIRTSGTPDTLALFGAGTNNLTIADWVSLFGLEANAGFYESKKVDVVGFVFHPDGSPPDVFYVSRFRVTCCAVDAQPIGVPVRSPGWQERFQKDDWVRVIGGFTDSGGGVAEPVVVDPERVEPTDQPKTPYVVY